MTLNGVMAVILPLCVTLPNSDATGGNYAKVAKTHTVCKTTVNSVMTADARYLCGS